MANRFSRLNVSIFHSRLNLIANLDWAEVASPWLASDIVLSSAGTSSVVSNPVRRYTVDIA